MGFFKKSNPQPASGKTTDANHGAPGGKSWEPLTTVGGASGNGWGSTDMTNGHDSAGGFDRNGWTWGERDHHRETGDGWQNNWGASNAWGEKDRDNWG